VFDKRGRRALVISDGANVMLFVGVKVTNALQRYLDELESGHGHLFEGRNQQSLQRVTLDGEELLGRSVERGATVESLGDIVRNLKSILLKHFPTYPLKSSEIRIYAGLIGSRY
jgi:hypothetical protein